ncbi:type II toxin-antitoxin system VapC family toxin [bacterium]|nr:type II toxin-antitoxin system VapC family toxin [bacterium]
MKYLIDTHALIWYAQGNNELSNVALELMENEECYYGVASLWEIAIKQKLGKIDDQLSIVELDDFCGRCGFMHLPLTAEGIEITKSLDFIHRDPFDRLLIAMAMEKELTIITRDTIIPRYGVETIW